MRRVIVLGVAMLVGLGMSASAQIGASGVALAEPLWPYGWMLPAKLGGSDAPPAAGAKADILVWAPEGATRIKAAFLVPNNSDSMGFAQCRALRAVATKHEMGIVYMRKYGTGIEGLPAPVPDLQPLPALLKWVAKEMGIPEFEHAPMITFGKSSRGSFPYRVGWYWPERMVASVTYHGETPSWPIPTWAKPQTENILELNMNGETEWGGTWYVHVRPSLLNYRAQTGWLPHQAAAWGVGHGDYNGAGMTPRIDRNRVWAYMSLFIDKALALRVPAGAYATQAPIKLNAVDDSTGYCIDPFAIEGRFVVPRFPLSKVGDSYVTGGDSAGVTGYVPVQPARDLVVPDGVPVVPFEVGKCPSEWVVASVNFAMQKDPKTELGAYAKLQPKPGDTVKFDHKEATFRSLDAQFKDPKGGMKISGMRPHNHHYFSLLAYTVLEVKEEAEVKLEAPFTPGGRLQVVLNGEPIEHQQVVRLWPGRYAMLVGLRLGGVDWGAISPNFLAAGAGEAALGKERQVVVERRKIEFEKLRKEGGKPVEDFIRKASDVPAAERKTMFWLADKELADAWWALHEPGKE